MTPSICWFRENDEYTVVPDFQSKTNDFKFIVLWNCAVDFDEIFMV